MKISFLNQPLIRRILNGLGANVYGQVATVIIQVVSLPVFLHAWGVDLYGEWLVLFAIPAYFGLSDVGFSNVAANEVTMMAARNETDKALVVYQSVWLFITAVSAIVFSLVVVATQFLPVESWCKFHILSHQNTAYTLELLTFYTLLCLQSNMIQVGFRCTGNYARGTYLLSTIRLAEFLLLCGAVFLGARPLVAALIYMLVRLTGNILIYLLMRRICPWLHFGISRVRVSELKRLIRPSVAFMVFPVSNALSLQGMVVAISAVIGPGATVIFSTMRTLSRFPLQVTNAINNTLWPEVSMAYGAGDVSLTCKLHIRAVQVALLFAFCATVFLALFSPWILRMWSHGKLGFSAEVGYPLLLVAFLNAYWNAGSILLAATNRHQTMALYLLGVTVLGIGLAVFLMQYMHLFGAAIALLLPEILMIFTILRMCPELLHLNTVEYLKKLFMPVYIR